MCCAEAPRVCVQGQAVTVRRPCLKRCFTLSVGLGDWIRTSRRRPQQVSCGCDTWHKCGHTKKLECKQNQLYSRMPAHTHTLAKVCVILECSARRRGNSVTLSGNTLGQNGRVVIRCDPSGSVQK